MLLDHRLQFQSTEKALIGSSLLCVLGKGTLDVKRVCVYENQ